MICLAGELTGDQCSCDWSVHLLKEWQSWESFVMLPSHISSSSLSNEADTFIPTGLLLLQFQEGRRGMLLLGLLKYQHRTPQSQTLHSPHFGSKGKKAENFSCQLALILAWLSTEVEGSEGNQGVWWYASQEQSCQKRFANTARCC